MVSLRKLSRLAASLCTMFLTISSPAANVVLITGENEYGTGTTLPEFAKTELEPLGHRILHVAAPAKDGEHQFENIGAVKEADVLVISVRRRAPQRELIELIRAHLAAGKPVVGIRTASHAFELRKGNPAPGHADWPAFDTEIFGADYTGHEDNKPPKGPVTIVTIASTAKSHPILAGLDPTGFSATSHLYNIRNVHAGAHVLLEGRVDGKRTTELVAWTNTAGKSRIFYTSLGSEADFALQPFRTLLRNGIQWVLAVQGEVKPVK